MRVRNPFRKRPRPAAAAQVIDLRIWNDSDKRQAVTPISRPDAIGPLDHPVVVPEPVRADVLLLVAQLVDELAARGSLDGDRGDILDARIETWRAEWHEAVDATAATRRRASQSLYEQQLQDAHAEAEALSRLRRELRIAEHSAAYWRNRLLGVAPGTPPTTVTSEQVVEPTPAPRFDDLPLPELPTAIPVATDGDAAPRTNDATGANQVDGRTNEAEDVA